MGRENLAQRGCEDDVEDFGVRLREHRAVADCAHRLDAEVEVVDEASVRVGDAARERIEAGEDDV